MLGSRMVVHLYEGLQNNQPQRGNLELHLHKLIANLGNLIEKIIKQERFSFDNRAIYSFKGERQV